MLKKDTIEKLVETRLAEAISLFEAKHWSGAYYLGGYVIELAIKACIANLFEKGAIPDRKFVNSVYDHNLTALIRVAGREADLRRRHSLMLILPGIGSMLQSGPRARAISSLTKMTLDP
jgi:HEPN domain-containing protein